MKKLLPIAAGLAVFAGLLVYVLLSRAFQASAELEYRILYPPDFAGERSQAASEIQRILARRLDELELRQSEVRVQGNVVSVRLQAWDPQTLADAKGVFRRQGRLQLFVGAPREIQESFNRDGQIPPGYKAFDNDERMSGEYGHFAHERILVGANPVIEGRHISTAGHRTEFGVGGMRCVVTFELRRDGARLFDEAALRLFNETPRGLIVIVLDGRIVSKPVVNAERFDGSGIIEGRFDEKEAQNLAIVLRTGGLPVPVGRIKDGIPVPGEPESERIPK